MKKRLLKAAITTALTVAFAVPAFANPFSDVPSNHWAYDAVNKLSQAGIVDGYNGKFNGDKNMTRYEMAQVVAKAMTKSLNADQKATVDKLSKEFAVELLNLGVKVEGMQKQLDNMVKVSGDARVRYFNTEDQKDSTDYRARVTLDGKVNQDLKFNARLTSGSANVEDKSAAIKLDTANVTFNTYSLANTVGRQDIKLGSGFIMDTQMNGVATKAGNLKLFAGNATQNHDATATWQRVYGGEYGVNLNGAKITADYLKNVSEDQEIFGGNAAINVIPGVTANAEYVKNNDNKAAAQAYGVKFNKYGISATYRDVEKGGLTKFSTMNNNDFFAAMDANGFKGMEYQFDKDLAKNTALTLKYQDFEDQAGAKLNARGSAVVNVRF